MNSNKIEILNRLARARNFYMNSEENKKRIPELKPSDGLCLYLYNKEQDRNEYTEKYRFNTADPTLVSDIIALVKEHLSARSDEYEEEIDQLINQLSNCWTEENI